MAAGTNRFQVFIGVVVLLLATATVAQTTYFQGQLNQQRECLTNFVQKQSDVAQQRTQYNNEESALTKNAMLAFSEAAEHPEADNQKALIAALLKYKQEIGKVTLKKKNHPIPPFPRGACE